MTNRPPVLAPLLPELPAWMDRGLCGQFDPEVWFPERGQTPTAAKSICAKCPVRVSHCLPYSLKNNDAGVWAGLTEHERRVLRRNGGAPLTCRYGCGTTWTTPNARAGHERRCERREEAS